MRTRTWVALMAAAFIISYPAGLLMAGLYLFNYMTGIIFYAWNRRGLK
jgi:hypothetical protein